MSTTSAAHHVQAVIDLLDAAGPSQYAVVPVVKNYWDDTQQERGPGADQTPILYVWSPTGSSLDRFSMDGTEFRRNDTVEVQAWSLDESETAQLQRDVVDILSQYLDDNQTETPYTDLAPVTAEDFRAQNPARKTDHYVMSVTVETTGLRTREVGETAFSTAFDGTFG